MSGCYKFKQCNLKRENKKVIKKKCNHELLMLERKICLLRWEMKSCDLRNKLELWFIIFKFILSCFNLNKTMNNEIIKYEYMFLEWFEIISDCGLNSFQLIVINSPNNEEFHDNKSFIVWIELLLSSFLTNLKLIISTRNSTAKKWRINNNYNW